MKEEKKATRQSYGEALLELGKENEKIVVLDADLAGATKTGIFAKEYPERFFDMSSIIWCVAPSSPTVIPACVAQIFTFNFG